MGFKKLVTLVCDGPCGTALEQTEKAPAGWSKLMITRYEILKDGEKPQHPPVSSWLCPKCYPRLIEAISKAHFALTEKQKGESE